MGNEKEEKKTVMLDGDKITTEHGLLYRNGEMIGLPEADIVARKLGHMFAERLVKELESN